MWLGGENMNNGQVANQFRVAVFLVSLSAAMVVAGEPARVDFTWQEYVTDVGDAKVAYSLPNGGEFSPQPKGYVSLGGPRMEDKYPTLGGTVFGSRPQGRDLGDVLYRVSLAAFDTPAEKPLTTEELLQKLDSEYRKKLAEVLAKHGHAMRIGSVEIVTLGGRRWVHERRLIMDGELPGGDWYCTQFDNGYYVQVTSMLWEHTARVPEHVAGTKDVVEKIAASTSVIRSAKQE
jgi:hypothetical protein